MTAKDYGALSDYLMRETRTELLLSFDEIEGLIGFALPRASHRASWWDTTRAPEEKMPQRQACIEAGYTATRLADGSGVRFTRRKANERPKAR